MNKPFVSDLAIKKNKLNEKINEAFVDNQEKALNEQEMAKQKEEADRKQMLAQAKVGAKKINQKLKVKEERELKEMNAKTITSMLFSGLVFSSIPKDVLKNKIDYKDVIRSKSNMFFNEALKAELATFQTSPIFNKAKINADVYALNAQGVLDGKPLAQAAKYVFNQGRSEFEYLNNVVGKRIKDMVIAESKIINKHEEINEGVSEGRKYSNKTLIRKLHENAISDLVDGDTQLSEDIDNNEMNTMAFNEAIINAAIIEVASTSKLINFNESDIKRTLNR